MARKPSSADRAAPATRPARAATGRPALTWAGKRPLDPVARPLARPLRLVEAHDLRAHELRAHDWRAHMPGAARALPATLQDASREANLLFHADNKDMLACLLANGFGGRIKLIYIDPPFDSAANYARKVTLRGATGGPVVFGNARPLGEQLQYTDIWAGDDYLQFMYERLFLMRELLSEDGSLWLHCDHRRVHYLRMLLEEVFGADNYLNTISWRSQVARGAKVNAFYFPFSTHYLEVFARNKAAPTTWNPVKKEIVLTEAEAAAEYMRDERGFFRTSDPGTYSFERLKALHAEGRLYAPYGGEVVVDEASRRVFASKGGNIGVKYYLKQGRRGKYIVERAVDNLWDDIPGLGVTPGEDCGYPTQKTEALLRRIISVSSNPGDWVLDCFAGSGTALAVAQQMGRRWIGGDINRGAIQTIVKRLHAVKPPSASRRSGRRQAGANGAGDLPAVASHRFVIYADSAGCASDRDESIQRPWARVTVRRDHEATPPIIRVVVEAFVSPAVIERVRQAGAATALRIDDWRVVVDSIMIDPSYDGVVFHPALVDAPRKRSDLVQGRYQWPAGPGATTVAVRMTDVLGEELLIVASV